MNYLGSVWALRAFLPMLERGAPSDLVVVASVAGTTIPLTSGPYAASKHAQLAFARSVGMELEGRGIRTPRRQPGPGADGHVPAGEGAAEPHRTALRRVGRPRRRGRRPRGRAQPARGVRPARVPRRERAPGARARGRSAGSTGGSGACAEFAQAAGRGNDRAMARLRRVDLNGPGHQSPPARRRLGVLRRGRREDRRPRDARPDPRAGRPARVDGRLDLPVPERPHPGGRRRRGRAQAVPLPPALARAARRDQVREDGRVRPRRCPRCASRPHATCRKRVVRTGARPRVRRPSPRPRLLPDRRRGVRRGERELRARDDAQVPRDARTAAARSASTTRRSPASGRSATSSTATSTASSRR